MIKLLRFGIVSVLLCLLLSVQPALADKEGLSIDDAVTWALNASPLVQELEANFNISKADSFETRTLPNPELEVELGFPVSWEEKRGKNEIDVALSQPFRLSHGPLRNRLASLIAAAGEGEKEKELIGLIARVRLAFARAWVLSERQRILQEILPQARSLNKLVKSGLAEGAYGQGDHAIFRSETSKTEAELKGISAESVIALAELNRLTNSLFQGKHLLAPKLLGTLSIESLKERLDRGDTKVQSRAKILLELAKADSAVAKRDAFPELRPRLFYSRTNEAVDIVGFGISFELPFYSQNTAERIRTEAKARSSQAQFNFTQSDVFKTSLLDAARAHSLRGEELSLYEKEVLPALREALTSFEQQIRKGEGSIFQLWQTLREYIDTQERYLELWTRVFSERAELSILLEEEI